MGWREEIGARVGGNGETGVVAGCCEILSAVNALHLGGGPPGGRALPWEPTSGSGVVAVDGLEHPAADIFREVGGAREGGEAGAVGDFGDGDRDA